MSLIEKMAGKKHKRRLLTPPRFIFLSYIVLMLVGALFLSLPICNRNSEFADFLQSIFHATSALCLTGLTLSDIAFQYTALGQTVLLLLMQIGGLGFMTITAMMFSLIKRKMSLKEHLILSESLSESSLGALSNTIKKITLLTLIAEACGAVALLFVFVPEYGAKGVFYSIFHSVSAFCNVGMDILPVGESLSAYRSNALLCLTITSLSLLGGIGYVVLFDMFEKRSWHKLSTHTKVVLVASGIVTLASTLVLLSAEYSNPQAAGDGFFTKLMSAFFLSVSARSSGFFTVNTTGMTVASKLVVMLNMFVGSAPSSTAGGIKITTVVVILLYLIASLKGKRETTTFKHTIPEATIRKAISVFIITITLTLAAVILLSLTESALGLGSLTFESVSALSNAGISDGALSAFSTAGKAVVVFLMFTGRVGYFTFGMLFLNGGMTDPIMKYPEAKLMV